MKRKMIASMVLAGSLALGGHALAQETEHERFCDTFGKLAEHAVKGRDGGIPLQEQIAVWREELPKRWTTVPADKRPVLAEILISVTRMAYAYPELTQYATRWLVTKGCLNPNESNTQIGQSSPASPLGRSNQSRNDRY